MSANYRFHKQKAAEGTTFFRISRNSFITDYTLAHTRNFTDAGEDYFAIYEVTKTGTNMLKSWTGGSLHRAKIKAKKYVEEQHREAQKNIPVEPPREQRKEGK